MGGPDADALHFNQVVDHLGVGKIGEHAEIDSPAAGMASQIADVGGFLLRQPQFAHFLRTQLQDIFRGQFPIRQGAYQAVKDDFRHSSAQLLIND